jgi:hypothetical protein
MKNLFERINGFAQGFLRDAVAALSSAFTADEPVLVPIRVQSMTYYASKRNPYAN